MVSLCATYLFSAQLFKLDGTYHRRHCRYCPVGIAGVVLYLV